jgi:hypothetical protein
MLSEICWTLRYVDIEREAGERVRETGKKEREGDRRKRKKE